MDTLYQEVIIISIKEHRYIEKHRKMKICQLHLKQTKF